MKSENSPLPTDPSVRFPWLTVEVALWGLLFAVALGLRLLRLDAAPLNAAEARGALAAWRFGHGGGAPTTTDYSPILFSSQWFIFFIFGASDLVARLLPALAGTTLALTPALLRQELGRFGALLAGLLLALSPTALTLSRTASGDVLVALGALLCAGGLWRFVASRRASEWTNAQRATLFTLLYAFGLALMLVSSPLAYSALLALGGALLVVALSDPQSREWFHSAWITFRTTPNLAPYALGTLLGGFVLLSTAFAWHFGGLASAAGLLTRWLGGFIRWPDSLSLNYPVLILFIYEPLILFLGGAGASLAMMLRQNAPSRFLALWSLIALALALIRPGHGPGDVLLVVVPLACLSGLALEALILSLRRWGHWLNEGPLLFISAPLWAWLAINLATYGSRPTQYTQISFLFIHVALPTYLSLTLSSLLLLLVLSIILVLIQGLVPTLRALGLSTTLALLLFTVAATWGVSQNRPNDPREPLVLEPTADEVRLLAASLARLSNEHAGAAHAIDLTVMSDDPALAWVLRDFQQARFVTSGGSFADATEASLFTSVVIAPQTLGLETPRLGEGYVGQSFALRRRWETSSLACRWNLVPLGFSQGRQLDCSALAQWLVFRRSPEEPAEERVVLWLRQDLANQQLGRLPDGEVQQLTNLPSAPSTD